MRTRFLNLDYFTPTPIQTLETLTFLHLPIPNLHHSNLSASDVLRAAVRFDPLLHLSLPIEQLPIADALSNFFAAVLPQHLAVDVSDFDAAAKSEKADVLGKQKGPENQITAGLAPEIGFHKEDGGRREVDNDALQCEVLKFETLELDEFLENSYIYEKDEMPILLEVPEETLNLTMQYPWDVQESVHTVEDLKSEYPTDQKPYSFEEDSSRLDQMNSYQMPFPLLEANEISLQNLTALSLEDELFSVYENIEPQHLDQSDNLNGKELLGSKEYGILELLSDNCLLKQCVGSDLGSLDIPPEMDLLSMLEMSQSQGNTEYQGTSISSCFQSVSPVVFQEFQILDLDPSLILEVLFNAQTANEPESCDWMFNGELNFNNLIVSPELALVDDTFKSLPVPVLYDQERICLYVVIEEKLSDVKPQPLSASDRIYLDWHLLEKDSTCQVDSCQKKMLEDMNPLTVPFYWDSFDDEKFYDLVFSGDSEENTEDKELQLFLSDAIPLPSSHFEDASTRLSGGNFPLRKTGEHIDKRSAVDGLDPDESKTVHDLLSVGIDIDNGLLGDASTKLSSGNLAQPKKRQHIEKKGAERTSLLFKSILQFNDIDFFLNPRVAATDENCDYAVMTADKAAPCAKGERSNSVCAQVDNRNEQKSKELCNSFPSQEEYNMRSKEDSDEVEASSIPHPIPSMPFATESDHIQQSSMSFPETIIVVNTQNLDKEMLISRRSTYQKILAIEKKGAQVVERDSELPIDIILSSAVCLVWYDCRNIGKKATALDEASSCLALCIENIAMNVLTMLSITFNSCILIFEGDTSFLSTVMESSDGLYAAAASLGIDLQVFNSYSSELTDEIILSCIERATKSIRGVFPQMPESESLAESFLTKFPSLNALSAHAILSSGVSLTEFLRWSNEKRIHAIQRYHVPDESLRLFSAVCRYGERGDSKSIMTDCSSSVSSGPDSGRNNLNFSERKRRKYNDSPEKYDIQMNESLHLEPLNIFTDAILEPPAAFKPHDSCMSKSPQILDEFRKPLFSHNDLFDQEQVLDMAMKNPFGVPQQYDSHIKEHQPSSGTKRSVSFLKDKILGQRQGLNRAMNNFEFRDLKNSRNLLEDVKGEVIDLTESPIFDLDFSSIDNSTEFPFSMSEHETDTTRKYKAARKLSFGSGSHRTFPTAAEIESSTTVWSPIKEHRENSEVGANNYTDMEIKNDVLPPRQHNNFLEKGFRQRSSGIQGMHLHENDISPYGGTQLSNALHSDTPQQNSPWTIEFLNKIKEKSRLRQQSFPRDLSSPISGYSGNVPKVTKRRSPSILEFFKYEGGSTPRKLPERKRQKRPVQSSRSSKIEKSSAYPLTALTPVDKRARQTLSFATNKSGSQTKLVWSDEAHGPSRKFQSL
ncbi:protein SHORTAGE IN CHIASMATA 1 [Argentina anserina]|uniref:protein SHORTAGE IN CHIASMATA 1 n=1 Tax=Argentina anserina TaxID=57926 RepID=UPI0021763F0F|nr:protein SHORTAGE IN CHIASMATA 1 [Potentilla anserina]